MDGVLTDKPRLRSGHVVTASRYVCFSAIAMLAALVLFAGTLFILPDVKYVKMLKGNFAYQLGKALYSRSTLALVCYRRSAALGNAHGMNQLGNLYWDGRGLPRSTTQALTWYRKAADLGDIDAMYNIGYAYSSGIGVSRDFKKALIWQRKAAGGGDPDAMDAIGYAYWEGHGVLQDYRQALIWYHKASELKSPNATYMIGVAYRCGDEVPKNDDQATIWYRKGAQLGSPDAMNGLANSYDDGRGAPQDYVEAQKWYRKAAALGSSEAMIGLGEMYHKGEGMDQDFAQAAKWFRKAADLGNPDAMFDLGLLYENGQGLPKDNAQSLAWYRKAARLGNTDAMLSSHRLAPEILTKDPAFTRLLNPPLGDALLNSSITFVRQKQAIEAKLFNIHDPDLRARISSEEWGKVNKSEFIEQERQRLLTAFPSAMEAVLAKHRIGWWEVGHVSFPGTSEFIVTSVQASPVALPGDATVTSNVAVMDETYAKFHAQIEEQVENIVSLRSSKYPSCEQQLNNICANLGGSSRLCSDPSHLDYLVSSVHFSCESYPSHDELRKSVGAEMRESRLILVGQGDILAHRLDKLMVVDYDTETVFFDVPISSFHGELHWKALAPAEWIKPELLDGPVDPSASAIPSQPDTPAGQPVYGTSF